MKVLNLQCHFKHDFEGWFGSEEDFRNQLSKEMIECPMCGSREITKMLSAPRLNLGAQVPADEMKAVDSPASSDKPTGQLVPSADNLPVNLDIANLDPKQLQSAWLKMVSHVMANTEDVERSLSLKQGRCITERQQREESAVKQQQTKHKSF